MSLTIGQPAPDFTLVNQHGEQVTLSSYKGKKNVVVVFYPFSFSGTCTGELCALRDNLASFQNEKAELLAVSCDAMHSQRAFAEKEGYKFPVLADSGHMAQQLKHLASLMRSEDALFAEHSLLIRKASCVGRSSIAWAMLETLMITGLRSLL